MKFEISQPAFLDCLKIVARAVSGQNTLPVLGNVLIRAEGKKVYFTATNLDISISTSTEAIVKNEGALTIPAKILTAYVSLLDKDEDLELASAGDSTLAIRSKSSQTKIKGIASEEFPKVSYVEGGIDMVLPSEDFRESVHKVAFSAQENSSRPILSGVYLITDKKSLTLVATDSYRLSEQKISLSEAVDSIKCVIPVRTVLEADRLAGNAKEVAIRVTETQVSFTVGQTQLVSRLIDGQFPAYKQIIPKEFTTDIIVTKSDLESAVRRVSIFAKENNQHMKLDLPGDGKLIISTGATEIGEENATLTITMNGEPSLVALNSDYVLDVLSAFSGESKVRLYLGGKLSPVVFKKEKGEDFTHLIMPLKM